MIATRNRGQVREIRRALKGLKVRIDPLNEVPDAPGIVEDGKTFRENALKKARFYSSFYDTLTIADDSGLEVDALNGRPGIYSARYAGERASDRDNIQKLLGEMSGVRAARRGAWFRCSIAIAVPSGEEAVADGSCKGKIGFKETGRAGFGYDPIFVLPQYGKTMAQLTLEEKNRISHRGKALRKLRKMIKKFIN